MYEISVPLLQKSRCVDARPTHGKLQAAVQGPAVTAENTVAWVATEKVSTGRKAIAK